MSGDAKKNDQGKLRYDLIPPESLRELARVYTIGAHKYADDNWKNGLDRKRIEAALFRHFEAARAGETFDPEDGQRHLASVAWCAFALMWYDMQVENDDTHDREKASMEAVQDEHQQHVTLRKEWMERFGSTPVRSISADNDGVAKELDRIGYRGGRMTD